MAAKQSFGGGYGLHRGIKGESCHATAKPPMANVNVKPGSGFSRADTGKSGKKHFAGARSIKNRG